MVKLIKDFTCAPEGHTTLTLKAGAEVSGIVAAWAIDAGAAVKPRETKPAAGPEIKKRGRRK